MSGNSEFDLKLGRYLIRKGKLLVTVIAKDHAEPLLEEIRKYERNKNSDYAESLLVKMEASGGLSGDIRRATNLDAIRMETEAKRLADKEIRGNKYECKCGQLFYDLEHEKAICPKCSNPKSECKKLG